MAVLSGATASGTLFSSAILATSYTILYTAKGQNANVTSPSATAYIKEIILCNTSGSVVTVTVGISSSSTAGTGIQPILYNISINPSDTKFLSGLNTMLSAGWTIQGLSNTSSAVQVIISGVEVN